MPAGDASRPVTTCDTRAPGNNHSCSGSGIGFGRSAEPMVEIVEAALSSLTSYALALRAWNGRSVLTV